MQPNAKVLTVGDLSEYLRVHRTTIYRLLKKGQIPAFKVGSDWRFNIEDIEHWRMQQQAAAEEQAKPSATLVKEPEPRSYSQCHFGRLTHDQPPNIVTVHCHAIWGFGMKMVLDQDLVASVSGALDQMTEEDFAYIAARARAENLSFVEMCVVMVAEGLAQETGKRKPRLSVTVMFH